MTEQTEQAFGEASVEQHAGWKAMEVANPVKVDDSLDVFGPGLSETGRAADELAASRDVRQREREARPHDGERFYQHMGGPQFGERMPKQESVSLDQAAADLTGARNREQTTADLNERDELAREIDALRSGVTTEQLFSEQPAAEQQPQPEPIAQPQQPIDPVAKALAENPALLNEVNRLVWEEQAKSNAAADRYATIAAVNAHAATAALVASYPELAHLNPAQIPTAIQVIAQQNPDRARAMVNHIQQVQSLVNEGQ
jgi:hypothetical protein